MGIKIKISTIAILAILTIFATIPMLICAGVWKYQEWIDLLHWPIFQILPLLTLLFLRDIWVIRENINVNSDAKDKLARIWGHKDFPRNPTGFPHDLNTLFHSDKTCYIKLSVTFPQFLPPPFFSSMEKIYNKFVKIYADLARKFIRLLTGSNLSQLSTGREQIIYW